MCIDWEWYSVSYHDIIGIFLSTSRNSSEINVHSLALSDLSYISSYDIVGSKTLKKTLSNACTALGAVLLQCFYIIAILNNAHL